MFKRRTTRKTRGNKTLTEAQYWGKVRSGLRRAFRFWPPITEAKMRARRPVENKGRQKWEYQCNHCQQWFKDGEVQVDHINPVGKLNHEDDLVQFLRNLTAEEGYQVLCKECHTIKTNQEKENARKGS